jgi:hypothetical protein
MARWGGSEARGIPTPALVLVCVADFEAHFTQIEAMFFFFLRPRTHRLPVRPTDCLLQTRDTQRLMRDNLPLTLCTTTTGTARPSWG